jgi:hypothetical protein
MVKSGGEIGWCSLSLSYRGVILSRAALQAKRRISPLSVSSVRQTEGARMTNTKCCDDLNHLSWHDSKLRSFSVVRHDDTDDVVLSLELRGISEAELTSATLRLKDAIYIKIEMDLEGKFQCADDISSANCKMESELRDELVRSQFKYSPTALDGCFLFDLYHSTRWTPSGFR